MKYILFKKTFNSIVLAALILGGVSMEGCFNKKNPIVEFKTSLGTFAIECDADKAPGSTENFVKYVKDGHYAGTVFHRVISNFMIQGGGYTKDMQEKPTRDGIKNEAGNGLKNLKGTVAMARTAVVDSASSQFFINVVDNAFLDHQDETPRGFGYAVFGKIVEGMDVVEKIRSVPTESMGPHQNVPVSPVIIESASVRGG